MKPILSISVVMATMLSGIVFAQSTSCDAETQKAKAISERCTKSFVSSTKNYNKCLEKYKASSEKVKSGQDQCYQEHQDQQAKFTSDYNKCLEDSGYNKCIQEYQDQQTKLKSDYNKCLEDSGYNKCMQEYQAKLMQTKTTSGQNKCMEEYRSQMAQGIKTAANDYTKCIMAVQAIVAEANKTIVSDYTKCLEATGYTKCQQENQTRTTKLTSDLIKCRETSNKCQQEYQSQTAITTSNYTNCTDKYKILSEQVTNGQAKCQQEYQAQYAKIDMSAFTKCSQELQTQQAKADKICPRTIKISELEERNGVYFMKNKPYSGKVSCSDCTECGWSCVVNMKNGKFHGLYNSRDESGSVIGNFKDGKEHGEWKYYDYNYDSDFPTSTLTLKYYIDGEEQK